MQYKKVMVIGDMHIPYHHKESFAFLRALKKKYKGFDLVVNIGDELDQHAISMHDSNPDLPSAGDELKLAKKYVKDFKLDKDSYIIDVGSNDGIGLKPFMDLGFLNIFENRSNIQFNHRALAYLILFLSLINVYIFKQNRDLFRVSNILLIIVLIQIFFGIVSILFYMP